MKRRFCLLFLLLGFFLQGWSQSMQLIVHAKSGAKVSYALSEKPIVKYMGDVLVLATENTTVEYPLSDLQMFTFSETEDAVESVTMKQPKGDGTARVYNMSGILVRTIQPSPLESTDAKFSTRNLPNGTYIIKQGNQTYKITKK